jgi:hypothetical protein
MGRPKAPRQGPVLTSGPMAPQTRQKREKARAHSFSIRFDGGGLSPKSVRLGELAEVLRSVEEALAAIMGLPPEEVVVGLIGVKNASAGYLCSLPSLEASRAFDTWSQAIDTEDFSAVPEATIEPSKKILSFVRRKNCIAELRRANATRPVAEMTPDTIIVPSKLKPLVGQTTLYGYCQRVGGVAPRLWMRLADGTAFSADVVSEPLARTIGRHLYEWIGVSGRAKWHVATKRMLEFKVDDLLPYVGPDGAKKGMMDLAKLIGPHIMNLTGDDVAALRE